MGVAFDVVVFEQLYVSAHFGDGGNLHHHDTVNLREFVLIHATVLHDAQGTKVR